MEKEYVKLELSTYDKLRSDNQKTKEEVTKEILRHIVEWEDELALINSGAYEVLHKFTVDPQKIASLIAFGFGIDEKRVALKISEVAEKNE